MAEQSFHKRRVVGSNPAPSTMKKNVDLSIIIVSYNTKKITESCINSVNRSLEKSKIIYEIVVADNASKDGSHELLTKMATEKANHLVYFQTGRNLGFGKGNNFAVRKSKGKYILLLNSDTIVLDRAIEKLFQYYIANEKIVKFVGAKLLNSDLTPQASAARFFTLPVVFATLLLKGDYYGLTRFSPNVECQVDWVSGACILTKRTVYDRLGGFDKDIFMYMEEVDLLYRAKKIGYRTYFFPNSQIIHLGSASSGGKTFPIIQVYRGFLYFYKKHYSFISLTALHLILKTKALIAYIIGRIKGDKYLIETYAKAFWIS